MTQQVLQLTLAALWVRENVAAYSSKLESNDVMWPDAHTHTPWYGLMNNVLLGSSVSATLYPIHRSRAVYNHRILFSAHIQSRKLADHEETLAGFETKWIGFESQSVKIAYTTFLRFIGSEQLPKPPPLFYSRSITCAKGFAI